MCMHTQVQSSYSLNLVLFGNEMEMVAQLSLIYTQSQQSKQLVHVLAWPMFKRLFLPRVCMREGVK